jgi:hypothetical protein
MNVRILNFALGVFLLLLTMGANAQKMYTEGVITYAITSSAESGEYKISFRGDTNMVASQEGPAFVKKISTVKTAYFAILVEVAAAEWRRVAILTPTEISQLNSEQPRYTFTPTTEVKQIGKFNCKKVIGKDSKSGNSIDVWVTNDITAPANSFNIAFADVGGFPVQFSTIVQGQKADVVLKDVSGEKLPAGIFKIPTGYDHVTYDEIKQ